MCFYTQNVFTQRICAYAICLNDNVLNAVLEASRYAEIRKSVAPEFFKLRRVSYDASCLILAVPGIGDDIVSTLTTQHKLSHVGAKYVPTPS